jgi:uncharacterized protein YecT (DUF1311 family)
VSSQSEHELSIDDHNLAVTRSIDRKPTMRPRLPALLAASLMIIGTISAQAAPDRVALVIGNGTYSFASHLKNPVNDAADIAGALREIGFTVIDGIDLDRRAMEDKIRAFGNALGSARTALFFYAGHGMQVTGRNYLIPIDARLQKPGDLALDTVDVQVVLQQMEAQPRVNLVFLDACRDNPLARSFASALGASRSSAVGQGLASIQSAVGTMIAFATQPDNVAFDGEGRNSPFTAALLRHIREPGVDIAVMMRRVRTDVLATTGQRQLPWDHSSLTDAVVLVPAAEGAALAAGAAAAPVVVAPAAVTPATQVQAPVAALALPPQPRSLPSFDCAVNPSETESAICANEELSRLDSEMAARYARHIRSLTEPARSKFVRDQRAWLRERNLCGHDVKCLTTRYQERLTAFAR